MLKERVSGCERFCKIDRSTASTKWREPGQISAARRQRSLNECRSTDGAARPVQVETHSLPVG